MKFTSKENLELFAAKFKAWVSSRKITASDMDSGSATSGQVPTADGQGGVTYATPSGGGAEHLYWHSIQVQSVLTAQAYLFFGFIAVVSTSPTAYTKYNFNDLLSADTSAKYIFLNDITGGQPSPGIRLYYVTYGNASKMNVHYIDSTNTEKAELVSYSQDATVITDTVNQIF